MFYTYLMLQTVSYQSADLMIVEAMWISKRVDANYLMPRIRLYEKDKKSIDFTNCMLEQSSLDEIMQILQHQGCPHGTSGTDASDISQSVAWNNYKGKN